MCKGFWCLCLINKLSFWFMEVKQRINQQRNFCCKSSNVMKPQQLITWCWQGHWVQEKQVSMSPSLVSLLHSRLLFYRFLLYLFCFWVSICIFMLFYIWIWLFVCLENSDYKKKSGRESMRTGFLPKACCL